MDPDLTVNATRNFDFDFDDAVPVPVFVSALVMTEAKVKAFFVIYACVVVGLAAAVVFEARAAMGLDLRLL